MNASILQHLYLPVLAFRRFYAEKRLLWAASLTFTTIFALVPLLSVLFFVFNVFGDLSELKALIQPYVYKLIAPGAQQEALRIINDLVEHVDFKTIGIFSTCILVVSVFLLLFEVECSLNEIWLLRHRVSLLSRAALYWATLTIGPLLVAVSLFIIVTLQTYKLIRTIEYFVEPGAIAYASYGLMWIAFTALYYFMPGTKVRFGSALFGGIIAGTAWKVAGLLFSLYTSKFFFYYPKVYGSLAAVPTFLLWIFFCWTLFLLGAEITYLHQHRDLYRNGLHADRLNASTRRYLTLLIMLFVARRFHTGGKQPSRAAIAAALRIPPHIVQELIGPLLQKELLIASSGYHAPIAPGRPLSHITVGEVLDLAAATETIDACDRSNEDHEICAEIVTALHNDPAHAYRSMRLADIIETGIETGP